MVQTDYNLVLEATTYSGCVQVLFQHEKKNNPCTCMTYMYCMSLLAAPQVALQWQNSRKGLNDNRSTAAHLQGWNWDVCKGNGRRLFCSSMWGPSSVNDSLSKNESCWKGWNLCCFYLPTVSCCLGGKRCPTNVKHKRWRPTKRARPQLCFYCNFFFHSCARSQLEATFKTTGLIIWNYNSQIYFL